MRVLLRYAREPFETIDVFKTEVVRSTLDTLELANGVSLSAYPCRPEAARGLRACVLLIDELAFFQSTDGRPTDTEMLRVARGRVATTGGKIIVLSSPGGQSGALWELHRKHSAEGQLERLPSLAAGHGVVCMRSSRSVSCVSTCRSKWMMPRLPPLRCWATARTVG